MSTNINLRRAEVVNVHSKFQGTANAQMGELIRVVGTLGSQEKARLDLKPADGEVGRNEVTIWVERHATDYFDSPVYSGLVIAANKELADNWE